MPEARFCRSCGAPLKAGGTHETDAPISPHAQTIPLAGEGRATNGLTPDDARPNASDTARVGRTEIEQILRRVQAEYASADDGKKPAQDSIETTAPPQTTVKLAPETVATPEVPGSLSAPATSLSSAQAIQSARTARARRLWPVVTIALLCVALVAGAWALIRSRRANTTNAGSVPPIPVSDQKQLDSEKTDETEVQAMPQQVAKPETSPAVVAKDMEHPRATRNEQQVNAPKVSEPSASVSPTPSATPAPVPKTNAAQVDADTYYFKGLNMVNGREPKNLSDAELNAALSYFLHVQGGPHSAEARKYAERLGKEFDRRRKR